MQLIGIACVRVGLVLLRYLIPAEHGIPFARTSVARLICDAIVSEGHAVMGLKFNCSNAACRARIAVENALAGAGRRTVGHNNNGGRIHADEKAEQRRC